MSATTPSTQPSPSLDDRVLSLPGLKGPVDGVQFAGYASVIGPANPRTPTGKDEELFYWFAGTADYATSPTILWTNGGPGSSSFWGFFLENGPYEISGTKDEPVLTPRPMAWNTYANYMIFEHPLSVTLSFVEDKADLPPNVETGIQQLYQALLNFIEKHPEIAANPIVLAGESYAGTYLPLLSKAILEGNKKHSGAHIDLRATVLLDAWVNPMVQMAQDTKYALTHGLISAAQKKALDKKYKNDLPNINSAIANICGCYMANTALTGDPSFYPTVVDYLNRRDVRKAIHAKESPRLPACSDASWSKLISDLYTPDVNVSYADVVEELINGGLQIMVISGLNDAKDCNFLGTGAWLDLLSGPAAADFAKAPTNQWRSGVPEQVLGYIQDGGVLSWVKVLNAGHLAVLDQPLLIELILQMTGV